MGKNRSSFLKAITILASGSIVSQIAVVVSAPLITRLYTPSEIGLYTLIITLTLLFTPIVNARYDMSIVSEKEEYNVLSLIKLSMIINVFLSLVITSGIGIYIFLFSDQFTHPVLIVVLTFLILISAGVINILNAYNNRLKEYKIISKFLIVRSIFQNFGAVLLGYFSLGMFGLLIPYVLGQLAGLKKQSKSIKNNLKSILSTPTSDLISVAKKHKTLPKYSVPAIFINGFSYSSLTFFIGLLYGMAQVGFYSISIRILGLPLSVISSNVSRVFFEAASREYDESGQYFTAFKKTSYFLIVLAVPLVLVMYFFIPPLTIFFFGENWNEAGIYIKSLAIMFGLRFVVTTLTPGLHVSVKQNYELILQSLFILASLTVYFITHIYHLDILTYLYLINLSFSSIYIFFYFVIMLLAKNKNDLRFSLEKDQTS